MSKVYVLQEMPEDFSIEDHGEAVEFSLKTIKGKDFRFRVSTDALEVILSNLKLLARKAMSERASNGVDRGYNPSHLPPFMTYATHYLLEENDAKEMVLVLGRRDRPDLVLPLPKGTYEHFREAFLAVPVKTDRRTN